jgi:hypothetical protein
MKKSTDDPMRAAVLRQLAMLDDVARHGEPDSLIPLARTELHRLADGWRLLLTVHQPGEDGRCAACPARLRRRRWPCRVWTMAYQSLIGEGLPTRRRGYFWFLRRQHGSASRAG